MENMTVVKLNGLLKSKTIDENSDDPLPYFACPICGSTNIERQGACDDEHDEMYYTIRCTDCGWNEWRQ